MARLLKIDPLHYPKLDASDLCYHIGEYTAGGGFGASATNQSILNLKKKLTASTQQLYYKQTAINQWGDAVASVLSLEAAAASVTFIPAPCSKPLGHPEYDDRMLRVMQRVAQHLPAGSTLDVRLVLNTVTERQAQHEGERLSIEDIKRSLSVDEAQLDPPLRGEVVVIDDVFTQGGTFKAMQSMLATLPGVQRVAGLFLAKTVWPTVELDDEPLF